MSAAVISHVLPFLVAGGASVGVITAAASTDTGAGLAPYVGGGATMILATALAEVMRRMLNGTLISKATRESELEMNAAILAGAQREDAYMKLAIENRSLADIADQRAEKVAADLAVVTRQHTQQVTDAIHDQTQALRDLREEIRRDRGN